MLKTVILLITAMLIITACDSSDKKEETAPICGDNTVNTADEMCDGSDLNGKTCETEGFNAGTLLCASNCKTFDLSQCGASETCGNEEIDGTDKCDGTNLGSATCESLGYYGGTLSCLSNCSGYDTTGCTANPELCGNKTLDTGEKCDGTELDGATCKSIGYDKGELKCNETCSGYNTENCENETNDENCTPNCSGKICGDDGCGGTCGTCKDNEICSDSGTCEEICNLDEITADKIVDINLETVTISGKITLNGQKMPDNSQEYYEDEERGYIKFKRKDTGDYILAEIGAKGEATYSLKLFKGEYEISFTANNNSYQNILPYYNITLNKATILDTSKTLDFNLETVTLSGKITLNGLTVPANTQEYYEEESRGYIKIIREDTGDYANYSIGDKGEATYSAIIFKGNYKINFSPNGEDYQNIFPAYNINLEKNLTIENNTAKNYNIETATLNGEIKLNGSTIPDNTLEYQEESDRAYIKIIRKDTGDYIYAQLGAKGAATYSQKIYKGDYDITFSPLGENYQNVLPPYSIKLEENAQITTGTTKNYNIETVTLNGEIKLNSTQMPDNTIENYENEERAYIKIARKDTGDYIYANLGAKGAATYNKEVYKGYYNITLLPKGEDYQNALPAYDTIIEKELNLTTTQTKNYNIETATLSGEIKLNNAQMPDNANNTRGYIKITRKENSDYITKEIGITGKAQYTAKLYKGSYQITFIPAGEEYQNILPLHTITLENPLEITSDQTKNYNLETAEISGKIKLNGSTMPDNTQEYNQEQTRGYIKLIRTETGDTATYSIQNSGAATYSTTVFKGSYNINIYPNNKEYQNVLPYIEANIYTGCYDFSAACDENADNITGKWIFKPTNAYWTETFYEFRQNGNELTGTYEGTQNYSGQIETGTVSGRNISFTFTTSAEVKVEGTILSGCMITGTMTAGNQSSPYIAEKIK